MASSPRDTNRIPAILVQDTVSSKAASASGILVGLVEAQAMALVDGSGNQIVSFGGGQQYTDGGVGVVHPIGTAIIFQGGSNIPNVVSAAQPLPITIISGNPTTIAVTQSGTWTVGLSAAQTLATVTTVGAVTSLTNALPAGTNNIGFVTPTPSTTGGWSPSSQTALTSTKTQIKSGAGNLGGYMFYNGNATVCYIQVWDVASASITVGTTAPTYVIPLPATSAANVEFTNGINHATAINAAFTTTPTGNTAPGTNAVGFFLFK